jgi:protein-S-isoprenylcysteine O-methyltransferase Ste14
MLLGVLVALDGFGAYMLKHRSRYKKVLENTVFNVVLVIVGHCVCYLIVILPPEGGWSARPGWMQHASVRIGFPIVGLLLICAGAFLAIAALKQRKVIGVQEVEEGLLTSGLYRYFRHPIYTGILWVTLGLALLIRNPDGLLMFLAILTWLFAGTMLEEKLDMCIRFPEQYRNYRQTTRMFGPIWLWVTLIVLLAVLIGAAIAVE